MTEKVWCPSHQQNIVNLNQTAVHSENPLKNSVSKNQMSTFENLGSTDFLLSENLNGTIFKTEFFKESTDSKILAPRENTSLSSSSNHQTSDHLSGPQETAPLDVVPLKNTKALPEISLHINELYPKYKGRKWKVGKTSEPVTVFDVLEEFGLIECREEVVNTHNPSNHQYEKDRIINGGQHALERLAKDYAAGKMKTGTHGVVTNQKFDFLTNSKLSLKKRRILGKGGNGTVELCSFNDIEFVTKTIFRDFRPNEVLFTNSLSHEFIVKSHGLIIRNGSPQIIMDYSGENLLHHGLTKVIYENEIWDITYQILEALNYLHSNLIRHFDVKPENIVLIEDSTGKKVLKLADFGGANHFYEEVDCLSWTPAYMSPEMDQFYLKRQFPGQKLNISTCGEITEKCDIYSLALSILFLYVRGHILIKHVTQGNQTMVGQEKADAVSMQIVIMNAQDPSLGERLIPDNVGNEMKTLLTGMLKGVVNERLTAKEAMEQMKVFSSDVQHGNGVIKQQKKAIRRKSRSHDNKTKGVQPIQPKPPKLVIVTLDPAGQKLQEFHNTPETTEHRQGGQKYAALHNLEIEEQQRPLRDLNIDLQLHMIWEQSKNVQDEKMKQIIEEENRPLLKRLIKRKLKDKVNGEIAFKMTKMREELESSSSSSTLSEKDNTRIGSLSGRGNVVMFPLEYEEMQCDEGKGNIPNFDILDLQ